MSLYEYQQLTPVLFGVGAIRMLGEKVKAFGCKKAMCIFDAGVKAAGISEKAENSLKNAGVDYIIYDKVVADPPDSMLDEAAEIGRKESIDCVIGIGGGSSMDSAKAVSILQKYPSPISQYLNLDGAPMTLEAGVPVFLVPTSAGTGSEVTQMTIVTYSEKNLKVPIFTRGTLAIVDPELCITAPPGVTANGGMDAMSHAVEAITSSKCNPYSEVLGVAAIQKLAKYLPVAYSDGTDIEARSELSLAANWAGIAFSNTDVHVGHAAADTISAVYHTPHGLNCAWVTPAVLELVARAVPQKVKIIGEAMGVFFNGCESPEQIGKKTADACRELMKKIGIKSMEEYGFKKDMLIKKASSFIPSSPLCFNCPIVINEATASWIMSTAYDEYM